MNSEPGVPDPDQGPPTRPYGAPPPSGYGAAPPPGYGTAPGYGAAPPPAYGGPPPGAPPTSDETLWAVLSHVSFFVIALSSGRAHPARSRRRGGARAGAPRPR